MCKLCVFAGTTEGRELVEFLCTQAVSVTACVATEYGETLLKPWDNLTMAGGPDMYGIPWVFEPEVGGSMEVPGSELFDDANDWKDFIKVPDIDSWDWEGAAKANEEFLKTDKFVQMWIFTGWFERMISFMGFEDAAVALIDEDQEDAVVEMLDFFSDNMINLVEHCHKYFHPDGFYIHDDWGSSLQPFFNKDVAMAVVAPAMKTVVDRIHELGMSAELHSCGKLEAQVGNFVAAGWDSWVPMPMNDYEAMYDAWGDKIIISCGPAAQAPDATYEEQVKAGEEWVARFFQPGRYAIPNYMYFPAGMTRGFREGLYRASRQ